VVRHRSTFGVCEITRGCGRALPILFTATKVGRSFPLEHIIASAEVNAREGATEVMLASERYVSLRAIAKLRDEHSGAGTTIQEHHRGSRY